MTDHELVKLCKRNNKDAQRHLYETYKSTLYAQCLKYCKNEVEAQDNLQETFIAIFQNIKKFKEKGSFEGWMKRIAINKAIDRYKKRLYLEPIDDHQVADDDAPVVIEENQADWSLNQVLQCVQELPDRYRMVFSLYELDNYSHQEISTELKISVGTSKSNLHRAKLVLKEKLLALGTTSNTSIANG